MDNYLKNLKEIHNVLFEDKKPQNMLEEAINILLKLAIEQIEDQNEVLDRMEKIIHKEDYR